MYRTPGTYKVAILGCIRVLLYSIAIMRRRVNRLVALFTVKLYISRFALLKIFAWYSVTFRA